MLDEVALMPALICGAGACPLLSLWFQALVQLQPGTPLSLVLPGVDQKSEAEEMRCIFFTMEDNPSLTEKIKRRYRSLYSGAFMSASLRENGGGVWPGLPDV